MQVEPGKWYSPKIKPQCDVVLLDWRDREFIGFWGILNPGWYCYEKECGCWHTIARGGSHADIRAWRVIG